MAERELRLCGRKSLCSGFTILTLEATYNALSKIFTEIGCRKLKKAISDNQKEKDKSNMDNEQAFI